MPLDQVPGQPSDALVDSADDRRGRSCFHRPSGATMKASTVARIVSGRARSLRCPSSQVEPGREAIPRAGPNVQEEAMKTKRMVS